MGVTQADHHTVAAVPVAEERVQLLEPQTLAEAEEQMPLEDLAL